MITKSDEQLAKSLQAGEIKSLTSLIARYERSLIRYVSYLGLGDDSEDIVQETFIKMYTNINSYNPSLKFSSWLYRIAHNVAVSHLRKIRFTVPWEEYLDIHLFREPECHIDNQILKQNLATCLSKLAAHYREPLALYYLEDKSYEEIMDILRLPKGTIAARINRAKKKMRTLCAKTI